MVIEAQPQPPASPWRDRWRRGWQAGLWLLLLLLVSRLLYLPWSQGLAASDKNVLIVPLNTSVLLEGIAVADTPALTFEFDGLRSATIETENATLAPQTRDALVGAGARLPSSQDGQMLAWNVNRPPEATQEGLLRVELTPAPGGDLRVGTRDDLFEFGSRGRLGLNAVPQDFDVLSGWIKLGGSIITQAPDLPVDFLTLPRSDGSPGTVSLAASAASTKLGLGDFLEGRNSVAVRSVALLDEDGGLVSRICGAPKGSVLLWSALFQPRLEPQPPAHACQDGYLTASNLRLADGGYKLNVSGAGFVPGTSQWLEKLKKNIVLWPFIAALIAIPGLRFWKAVARKQGEKAG